LKIIVRLAAVPGVIAVVVFPCPWDAFNIIGADPAAKQQTEGEEYSGFIKTP